MWWLYFLVGDLLTCTAAGAAAGWLAHAVIPTDWFMALGMVVGMVLGMLASFLVGVLFTPLFGSLEVMLPASLSGMVAGMGASMAHTSTEAAGMSVLALSGTQAMMGGALAGLGCLVYTYLLQALLAGKVKLRETKS